MKSADRTTSQVIAGVDGSRAARQALLWAADESRLRQASLLIVHVQTGHYDHLGLGDSTIAGETLLRENAAIVRDLQVDITVHTELIQAESVSEALAALSATAELVVIGVDPTRSRASHGARGPIENRVAVHAQCPVVTVAGTLRTTENTRSPVVLGWTDTHAGHQALTAAAAEADLRGAPLTVVTVPPPHDYGLASVPQVPSPEAALIEAVAAAERGHPGLPINISHLSGEVAPALVSLTRDADLLVLGCHHSEEPWSLRTGPVADAAMRQAHCPVMLVGRLSRTPVRGRKRQAR